MAYRLTRGAAKPGLALPPPGYIEPKRRKSRPLPGEHKGAQGAAVWKPDGLALLGAVPDRVAAERLRGGRGWPSAECGAG